MQNQVEYKDECMYIHTHIIYMHIQVMHVYMYVFSFILPTGHPLGS